MKQFTCIVCIILALVALQGCKSGEEDPPEIVGVNTEQEKNIPGWFYSNRLGGNRYIYLRLPQDYDPNAGKTYPTIYLLDANWYFDGRHERIGGSGIVGVVNRLVQSRLIPDVILIGIGNTNAFDVSMRGNDFHSAKSPQFLNFIKKELMQEVNSRFNAGVQPQEDAILIGHSSAGYFSTYAMFQDHLDASHPIKNYVSLSVHSNDQFPNILADEQAFYNENIQEPALRKKLFIGVGGAEETRFLTAYNRLKDRLNSRNYADFNLDTKIYPGHDHSSYISDAIFEGLVFIFEN